jgi:MinD superfamily P-loop ATPase
MKEVVIISGKGGTGKTTLTGALASLWNNKVIADCDVDAANLHLLLQPVVRKKTDFYGGIIAEIDLDRCSGCGVCCEVCVFDAISGDFQIDPIHCEGCGVCFHFCPMDAISIKDKMNGEWYLSETRFGPMVHASMGIAQENSGKLVSLIRQEARKLGKETDADYILADGSPGIGCPVISTMTGAALVIVVTEPSLSGIHDMQRVLDLSQHFQIPSAVIINKNDLNEALSDKIQKVAHNRNSPVIGRIPFDPDVTKAMVQGKTVIEESNSELKRIFQKASSRILELIENK